VRVLKFVMSSSCLAVAVVVVAVVAVVAVVVVAEVTNSRNKISRHMPRLNILLAQTIKNRSDDRDPYLRWVATSGLQIHFPH
jgi:hypothetical protein